MSGAGEREQVYKLASSRRIPELASLPQPCYRPHPFPGPSLHFRATSSPAECARARPTDPPTCRITWPLPAQGPRKEDSSPGAGGTATSPAAGKQLNLPSRAHAEVLSNLPPWPHWLSAPPMPSPHWMGVPLRSPRGPMEKVECERRSSSGSGLGKFPSTPEIVSWVFFVVLFCF